MQDELAKLLQFEAPDEEAGHDGNLAEREAFRFPGKLIKKARELKECQDTLQKETQRLWEEKEKANKLIRGFVVRNLLPVVDSCTLGLASSPLLGPALAAAPRLGEPTPADEGPEGKAPAEPVGESSPAGASPSQAADSPAEPETPHTEAGALNTEQGDVRDTCLASILRSVLSLLAGLEIYRIELLGLTYDSVSVDGQKVDDPFEILATSQEGKAREQRVTEVIDDLWVTKRQGYLEILRKGKVNC